MRGYLYSKLGENEKAIADYTKSIELNSDDMALNNRAVLYRKLGENEKAIADYTQLIEMIPNDSSSYYARGVIYQELGEIEKALADFDKAIKIQTKFYQRYSESGRIDRTTIERAIEDFGGTKIDPSKQNPHFYKAYLNRGIIYSKLGKIEKALADYNQSIRINPEFAAAYVERGKIHCASNNINRFQQDWSKALNLSKQQENKEIYREAEQLLNDSCPKPLETYPTDVVQNITNKPLRSALEYIMRGNARLQSGELKKALTDFNEAIALDNDAADGYYYRGITYVKLAGYNARNVGFMRLLEVNKAFADFEQAITIAPNYVNAYIARGALHKRWFKPEQALADYNRAIEINPNYVISYNNGGLLYYDSGRIDLAYYYRGNFYHELEETEKALADYNQAIALGYDAASVYYDRGFLHRKLKNFAQCQQDLETAMNLSKKQGNSQMYDKIQQNLQQDVCQASVYRSR